MNPKYPKHKLNINRNTGVQKPKIILSPLCVCAPVGFLATIKPTIDKHRSKKEKENIKIE